MTDPLPADPLPAAPPPGRRRLARPLVLLTAAVAAVAIVLALAGLAPWQHPGTGPHAVSVPLGGRASAGLAVVSGADSITLAAAPLGGQLIRAATPAGTDSIPHLTVTGNAVQLSLGSAAGGSGPVAVTVTLNSAVAWRLTLSGGASRTAVFLGSGRLRGADFTAGSSQVTMRLPRPRGTVVIELAGGAGQVTLATPPGVPARLRLDSGAASATLGGQAHSGLAAGTVLTEPGWGSAADRYDIDAASGVSAISVSGG